MRFVLSMLGLLAGLVFMGASAAMNHAFMSGQGQTEYEGQILGAVAVAVSVSNGVLPFLIGQAWGRRRVLASAIGTVVFVVFLAFALLSALGFASGNRNAVTGGRETVTLRHGEVLRDLGEAERTLANLGEVRPQSVVEAELGKLRQDRLWSSSKSCEDATAPTSRDFCKTVFDARAALAAAVAGERLKERIDALKREKRLLEDRGAGRDSDPQARLLAELVGSGQDGARRFLIVFVACLVELGAAFLPFLAFAPWRTGDERRARPATEILGEVMSAAPMRVINEMPARRAAKRVEVTSEGALVVRQ